MKPYSYSKDGVTVAAILDNRRKLANGEYPVKIRVTHKRTRSYFPTGKSMSEENWERLPITRLQSLLTLRKDIENSFELIRAAVEDIASKGDFSIDALNARMKMAGNASVNAMIKSKEEDLRSSGHISTADVYQCLLGVFQRFIRREVTLDQLTVPFLRELDQFMRDEGKSQTTISIYMRSLRSIANLCKASGLIKESAFPFGKGKYEIQEGEGRKLALSLEQIGQVARYDDGSVATAKYRDYWMFLYFCNGINVADFVKLRYRDISGGEIHFIRQKTERTQRVRKTISVVISPEMQAIIDRWGCPAGSEYIFPILDGKETPERLKRKTQYTTRAINKRMSTVGAALGIGNISTYTARHSFATVLKRAGVNIAYISESLGHQNIQTTEHYLASFEQEERRKNAELLTRF